MQSLAIDYSSYCDSTILLDRNHDVNASSIGDIASWSLKTEALLSPKPGLVDRFDTGSHQDLTLDMMLRSAKILNPYFSQMAKAGQNYPVEEQLILRETIGHLGRIAEKAMMEETQGVNTHRGAIWALGLLSTASGQLGENAKAENICYQAGKLARLADKNAPTILSKGAYITQRYKINGAKEEAQNGFLSILECSLPELKRSRLRGDQENIAQLNSLLALMAHLSDTCVLSRSGLKGLNLMQENSQNILEKGGVNSPQGMKRLLELNTQMIELNASPGGAADLLAATLFVDSIGRKFQSKSKI